MRGFSYDVAVPASIRVTLVKAKGDSEPIRVSTDRYLMFLGQKQAEIVEIDGTHFWLQEKWQESADFVSTQLSGLSSGLVNAAYSAARV